jgi:hypothetical protein
MIRRLLATAATSAILLAGAIIALEAVGLLFRKGTPEPVIANVHIRPVPEESAPALLWKRQDELELARLRREAEQQASAADEERALADALRWADAYRRKRESELKVAALGPSPMLDSSRQVDVQPAPPQDRDLKLTASVAEPERSTHTVLRPSARPDRARSVRRGSRRASGTGCPFLGWLAAVMAPAAPRRGAT